MIRRLLSSETREAIRGELEYSRQRLSGDAGTADLVQGLEKLLQRLGELVGSAEDADADQQFMLLVEDANQERCRLVGELAARACASQLGPSWPTRFFKQVQGAQKEAPAAPERALSGPNKPEEWMDVAQERQRDAQVLLSGRPASPLGAVYMAGYAIECSLKALLRAQNQRFPTSGAAGHDLRQLWETARLRLSDLSDPSGTKAFFIEQWTTDLRYAATLGSQLPAEELLKGATQLASWLQTRARRKGRR